VCLFGIETSRVNETCTTCGLQSYILPSRVMWVVSILKRRTVLFCQNSRGISSSVMAALSKHVSIRDKSIRQSRQASLRDPLVTYLALCEDRNCSEYPWCHRYISSGWGTFQFPCLTQSRIVFWVSIVQIGNGRWYAFRGQLRPATLARQSSKRSLHILIRIGKLNLYLLKQYLDTQFWTWRTDSLNLEFPLIKLFLTICRRR
jgi:hypothetical protein